MCLFRILWEQNKMMIKLNAIEELKKGARKGHFQYFNGIPKRDAFGIASFHRLYHLPVGGGGTHVCLTP